MTRTNSPLQQLIAWAHGEAHDRRGRRMARLWAQTRPALAGFPSAGELVRTAWADPEQAAVLVAELMAIGDRDEGAIQAALAIVAPRLVGVISRWARCGVPPGELEDLECELVAATIERLRTGSGRRPEPPGAIVDWAWSRVRAERRRRVRALGRHQTLDPAAAAPELAAARMTAPMVVIDGYRSGRISLVAAQALWATGVAGWSSGDAARRLGCRPEAVRARRSRAIRALAA